ncbi:hypothetical protein B0H14DRAFT_2808617 [Mycena olivaceomarginata]|nr:hypothetical protein B0H14DRAFT_2808617 [Mycena olivaceomarginata]
MARMFSPHFPQLKESLLATISSIISTNGDIEFGQLVHWNLQDPALLAVQDFNKSEAIEKIAHIRTQLSSSPLNKYALKPHPDYNDESIVATRVSRSPQKEVELTLDDFPVRKHEKKAKKTPCEDSSEAEVGEADTSQATVTKKKATSPIKHVYSLRNRRPTQQ